MDQFYWKMSMAPAAPLNAALTFHFSLHSGARMLTHIKNVCQKRWIKYAVICREPVIFVCMLLLYICSPIKCEGCIFWGLYVSCIFSIANYITVWVWGKESNKITSFFTHTLIEYLNVTLLWKVSRYTWKDIWSIDSNKTFYV